MSFDRQAREIASWKMAERRANQRFEEREKEKVKYDFLINKAVNKMLSNFPDFKLAIGKFVNNYLNEIEYKFFRSAGKERARDLLTKIHKATCFSDIFSEVKEKIKEGNEEVDSLKSFLFRGIDRKYCENKADRFDYFPLSRKAFLNDIIQEAEKLIAHEEVFNLNNSTPEL